MESQVPGIFRRCVDAIGTGVLIEWKSSQD